MRYFPRDTGKTAILKRFLSEWPFSLYRVGKISQGAEDWGSLITVPLALRVRIQWNAGTACMSECVLKTLARRGLRVGPSKVTPPFAAAEEKVPW